jgi:hypothetical protein
MHSLNQISHACQASYAARNGDQRS